MNTYAEPTKKRGSCPVCGGMVVQSYPSQWDWKHTNDNKVRRFKADLENPPQALGPYKGDDYTRCEDWYPKGQLRDLEQPDVWCHWEGRLEETDPRLTPELLKQRAWVLRVAEHCDDPKILDKANALALTIWWGD